jgi:hypothetical protein
MVSQLRTFAAEVTRVALEVGTEGILGGQATVEGVQGVWADLTTNVNVCPLVSVPRVKANVHVRTWQGILLIKSDPSPKSPPLSQTEILARK